jgi:hypothetical protein
MQNFVVSAEFKGRVTDILSNKKFTTVFSWMNLINRENSTYTETELNTLVQFLGELPYAEVVELFNLIPSLVQKVEDVSTDSVPPTDAAEIEENHGAPVETEA